MDKVLEDIEKLKDANRDRQEMELLTMIESVVALLMFVNKIKDFARKDGRVNLWR